MKVRNFRVDLLWKSNQVLWKYQKKRICLKFYDISSQLTQNLI